MNKFRGHIIDIQTSGNLSVITVKMHPEIEFRSIVIDTPESANYISEDHRVQVVFKEMEVIITTDNNPGISLQNKIPGTIRKIEKGELLSRIVLDTAIGPVVSFISSRAVENLDLVSGSKATAMIKLNEIILSK